MFGKKQHRTYLRVFLTYGIHVLLLIFICNIVVFYSVRFLIRASTKTPDIKSSAAGPVVSLGFSLPGIGTAGANLKPIHTTRALTIYLFNYDTDIFRSAANPVYTIKSQATYDDSADSPDYGFFINKYIDMGNILKGKYQIVIQTPGSLPDLTGSFSLANKQILVLPPQSMITGDVDKNNILDKNDNTLLMNCFSSRADTSKCQNPSLVDLDDDGIVDSIDYNIMLLNIRAAQTPGFRSPRIAVPTPAISAAIPTPSINSHTATRPLSLKTVLIAIIVIFFLSILFLLLLFPLMSRLRKKNNNESISSFQKSGYLKKVAVDPQQNGTWVTLTDDNESSKGFYQGPVATDGFVSVKGTLRKDNEGKQYILISEINPPR